MKTETKFTPGPWKFAGKASLEIFHPASGKTICKMHQRPLLLSDSEKDPYVANAHLIAACPELFALVEEASEESCRCSKAINCYSCRARAVIAKATEGRKP